MPVPATTGKLCTSIADMNIGDYIVCKYVASSGAVGTFSEIGTSTATEIAVTGAATPNGTFYFVKVAQGLLCADRVVQVSVTWDVLNAGKVIQGKPTTFGTYNGAIRSLSGGVAYADANGNKVENWPTPAVGFFPLNNEWDKCIVNFPEDKIQTSKTLDDVFHYKDIHTWTQDTPSYYNSPATPSNRVTRGNNSEGKGGGNRGSGTTNVNAGFRPVFEFQES